MISTSQPAARPGRTSATTSATQPITNVQLDKATGDIYAGTDFGVLRLANGTTNWVKAGEGLPGVAVYHLLLAPGEKAGQRVLYAATHGRGVWRVKLGGGRTTRSDALRKGLPWAAPRVLVAVVAREAAAGRVLPRHGRYGPIAARDDQVKWSYGAADDSGQPVQGEVPGTPR